MVKRKILVIGSLNMDIVIDVDSMPLVGETVIGKNMQYSPGGKGANQAYAVGMLGGDVAMLGCVGDDGFGVRLIQNISKAGVDVGRIRRSTDCPTGTAVIYVDSHGDNNIVVVPGANALCNEQYLMDNDDVFQKCDYVLLQMEIPDSAVWYAVHRAWELGKTVILNPAPAPGVFPNNVLERLDYITPNETELARLCGEPCDTQDEIKTGAKKLVEAGARNVLVTMGKNGSLLFDGNRFAHFPATENKAVDSTGAGDCFNAAFLTALAEGWNGEKAIAFANVAAGIAVTRQGAQDSIPRRAEVEALL